MSIVYILYIILYIYYNSLWILYRIIIHKYIYIYVYSCGDDNTHMTMITPY